MENKEYIERGAAVQLLRECTKMQGKEIEKKCDTPILRNVLNVYYLARDGATTLLEDIPAADVVEVVRCKGCVWWEACGRLGTVGKCESPHNGLWNEYTFACDFCSYGERKEE